MRLVPAQGSAAGARLEFETYPSRSYALDAESGRISGYVDGLEAVRQAVEKTLKTERFAYRAYTGNYGVELRSKLGMPASYVLPELKRAICEALEWDSRIESVDGFSFTHEGRQVHASFTVHSIYGDIEGNYISEAEVTG